MDWVASAIWWHCFPLRFVGAEDRLDDLRGVDGPCRDRDRRMRDWWPGHPVVQPILALNHPHASHVISIHSATTTAAAT